MNPLSAAGTRDFSETLDPRLFRVLRNSLLIIGKWFNPVWDDRHRNWDASNSIVLSSNAMKSECTAVHKVQEQNWPYRTLLQHGGLLVFRWPWARVEIPLTACYMWPVRHQIHSLLPSQHMLVLISPTHKGMARLSGYIARLSPNSSLTAPDAKPPQSAKQLQIKKQSTLCIVVRWRIRCLLYTTSRNIGVPIVDNAALGRSCLHNSAATLGWRWYSTTRWHSLFDDSCIGLTDRLC